jgi:drug/metabolite transporter (DMT)-like permease
MLALGLGLTAALLWAVHDLLVRKLSQHMAILPIMLVVMAAGSVALMAPVIYLRDDWAGLSVRAMALAAAGGLAVTVAIGALYRAYSMAPVRFRAVRSRWPIGWLWQRLWAALPSYRSFMSSKTRPIRHRRSWP